MIGASLPSTSRTRLPESMCSRVKGLYRRICCMLNENYPAGWCAPDPFTYEVIAFPCTDRYVLTECSSVITAGLAAWSVSIHAARSTEGESRTTRSGLDKDRA
ncbi:unnamed protein product [Toxocara canis]|uniref:Uncharacterized protein n=1 Tax=Toxocara canis TaxID=6265 RepID=A0A183U4I1_TOXCA|nr:unnamed protein product [Toxocara canis]